jgi:AraC-like DNA-binding protein/quercetin dioxygenase-like cupin family protein
MQPLLIKVNVSSESSFSVNRYIYDDRFPGIWQFHDEFELTLIVKGRGTRLVGDHIDRFAEGDLIFVGKNLPHTWKTDEDSAAGAEALVIHFLEDFLGAGFFATPDMVRVRRFLAESRRGLRIGGPTRSRIASLMLSIESSDGAERMIHLLTVLHLLSTSRDLAQLSTEGFTNSISQPDSERLANVYTFIMNNFQQDIHLSQAAEIANMSPTAFSRYFKSRTRESFSEFLIRLRIGYACKLLMKEDRTVSQACFESGFQNLSNFNQQFKKYMKLTPKKYQLVHAR